MSATRGKQEDCDWVGESCWPWWVSRHSSFSPLFKGGLWHIARMPDDHFSLGEGAVRELGRGDNPLEIFTPVFVANTDEDVFSASTLGA